MACGPFLDGLGKPASFRDILQEQDDQAVALYLPFEAEELAAGFVVLALLDETQNAGKFVQPARERYFSRFRLERRFLSHKDAREVHRQGVGGLDDEKSEGKMQYLSGFLSASSSAAPLSAQQKCPLLNPECSMILCYFGLVEEFDPTASPSMSVLRQYRLGPVLACSQLLEPSFSIRVEHPFLLWFLRSPVVISDADAEVPFHSSLHGPSTELFQLPDV